MMVVHVQPHFVVQIGYCFVVLFLKYFNIFFEAGDVVKELLSSPLVQI